METPQAPASPGVLPPGTIDIASFLDESRFRAIHFSVLVLCTLIAVVDGFDVTAMAAVAPTVAEDWSLSPGALGPALSASLVGLAFGGIIGGFVGDRFGRRPTLVAMFMVGIAATAYTGFAQDLDHLVLGRFLTGLGLGGTIPLGGAMVSEYMPRRSRAFLLVVMFSGHSLGGALAPLVAPWLIEEYSWRALFFAGGILPVVLVLAMVVWLPESMRNLAVRGGFDAKLARLARRIDRTVAEAATGFVASLDPPQKSSVLWVLFGQGRAATTLLLWLIFFCTQFELFLLASWLPSLLNQTGYSLRESLQATTVFSFGGLFGTLAMGWLSDRNSPPLILVMANAITFFAVGGLAWIVMGGGTGLLIAATAAGVGSLAAQLCLNAFASQVYPTVARGAGLGWALAVGRIGSISSPLVVGALLNAGMLPVTVLQLCMIPPLLAIAAIGAFIVARSRVTQVQAA